MAHSKIKIAVIIGSLRSNSYTSRALNIVIDEFKKYKDVECEVFDPKDLHLNFPGKAAHPGNKDFQERVAKANGIILATPEYHGSYSSVIKLVIENLGYPSVISGKPVALLGVADGQIGAIKALEHLRSVCSHIGAIVLPSPVSVAGAHKIFDEQGRCSEPKVEARIRALATDLVKFIKRHTSSSISLEDIVRDTK
ncbi:MAG: hypothetical protein A2Z88_01790 [Omnitrophica WOR_2 bacterium GWA2_47_8]|nr:MAG: hypothetical protein A2Z88_01790 [Omnitrophica WOR_2 bacterium GWA2_47_8]